MTSSAEICVILGNISLSACMDLKIIIAAFFLTLTVTGTCQTDAKLNQTNAQGRKQGHWIKRYPDESIMYEGTFRDNHPVGEFRRYYEDKNLKSLLLFNDKGNEASAILYGPNGFISAKGKYVNQKKEGKWQFFSATKKECLISEENYSGNLRNGLSVRFYPDSTVAEKVSYKNDVRQGEWIRYYPGGSVCLRSQYLNGNIDGKFEVWFENGKIEFSGQYKNDARDGQWTIYDTTGAVRYRIEYHDGIANDRQMDIEQSDLLDALEKNRDNTPDPEKTGNMW